jgi:histone-lysine N-methyltransferase SETMAR
MLKEAFGDNAMSQSKTCLWYKRFKDGRTSVDDDERSGRPSTSTTPENIAKVREAILADRRRTIHDVCEIVGLSYGTIQRIFEHETHGFSTMTPRPPTHHSLFDNSWFPKT